MSSLNKPLKQILSKYFFEYWRYNNHKFLTFLKEDILHNVNRFLECEDPKVGYTSFICLKCKTIHETPFSCKSRFCSSCGKSYSETWAHNLANNLINCSHRHATFSLPTGWIRNFFFKQRHLLKNLAEASYLALNYSFNKIGISTFGSISTIHTFSRKIEWNPHIHCLVAFGGLTKNNQWKNIEKIPWQILRKLW